jgi:hypothetical protein
LLEKWRREDPHDTPPSSRQAVTNFRAYLREGRATACVVGQEFELTPLLG